MSNNNNIQVNRVTPGKQHIKPGNKKKRKVFKETDFEKMLFDSACPSQYNSTFVKNVGAAGHYDKLLDVLRLCGLRGKSIDETCEELGRYFSEFISGEKLDAKTLRKILKFYPDCYDAYTFNKELSALQAFKRANIIVNKTEDIEVIRAFHEMYDDTDTVYVGNRSGDGDDNSGVVVNIMNSKVTDEDMLDE